MNDDKKLDIKDMIARGYSTQAVATYHRVSVDEVETVLDQAHNSAFTKDDKQPSTPDEVMTTKKLAVKGK